MNEPRPARILFLAGGSAGTNVYGAERSLLDLIAGMDRTRFLPCCAVTQGVGPYVTALWRAALPRAERAALRRRPCLGVPVVDLRLRTGGTLTPAGLLAAASGTRALVRIARQAQADLIHVNALKVNQYAVLAARALGLPVVLHLQGHVNKRAYFTRLAFGARRIVACSEAVAAPWQGLPGGKRRLRVVYYGLDPAPFAFSEERRAEQRARLGLSPEVFAVGVVSRLSPSKKLETFFQALHHVAQVPRPANNPDRPRVSRPIVALVAGDAPPYWRQYGEMIRQLPGQMGISDRVVFLGYVEEMAPLYSAFDAVVAPSDVEGLCRVILEAMAASRPVIAVRAGGPVEVVEDAVTGLLVPPQDPKALGKAIIQLAQDDEFCRRLGDAAVQRVAERFSLAAYVRSLQDAYAELLAEPRGRGTRTETSQHAV